MKNCIELGMKPCGTRNNCFSQSPGTGVCWIEFYYEQQFTNDLEAKKYIINRCKVQPSHIAYLSEAFRNKFPHSICEFEKLLILL